jgi:type IX secretion system PorP/SprF family membrane protein
MLMKDRKYIKFHFFSNNAKRETDYFTLILVFLAVHFKIFAQDPVFSQFYNAHLQLNSAMAGNTRGPLIQLNYRNQWPALGNIYTTYSMAYDQYISKLKSGVGFSLLSDNAGDGTLRTTGLTGYYSYRVKVSGEMYIKGGMEVGFVNNSLDWNRLTFGDGIDPRLGPISPGGTPFPTSETPPLETSKNYLNIGAGFVVYSPKYYVGLSLKNLNTPDISFLSNFNSGDESSLNLPTRITLHAGSQIILRPGNNNVDPTFISPNIMIQRQRDFNQINLGAYVSVNKIHGGLWYRHSFYNGDALITSFGFKKDFLKFTYSFDITMSQLSIKQGGSHELGIILNFDYLYPKKQDYNDCFAIFR